MSTRLERHLQNIVAIPERIDRYRDAALNGLPPPPALITNKEQLFSLLAQVYCHLQSTMLGIGTQVPNWQLHLSDCLRLLHKEHGENALQTVFDIARTGAQGGVRQLIRTIADLYSHQYAEELVSMAVEAYASNRTGEEFLADAAEYVRNYRHILPVEITEGPAARIHANFKKALKQHPFVVRQLHRAAV